MNDEGICIKCGKTKPCLDSNLGSICEQCFHSTLGNDFGERVVVPPEPGRRVFVLRDGPQCFLTVHGTLYAYDQGKDAEKALEILRRELSLPNVRVEEMDAAVPFSYVVAHPELKLVSIAEFLKS